MKNSMWLVALVFGAVTVVAAAEYVYHAPQLDRAAEVDGVVAPDEYPEAVMLVNETPNRLSIAGQAIEGRAFHDGRVLYVAVTVPVTDSTQLFNRSDRWAQDDGAEVCFRVAGDEPEAPVFVIHGFSTGTFRSVTLGGADMYEASALEEAVTFAAATTPTSWTAEWAIPLEAAGIEFEPGLKLDFNIGVLRTEFYEWVNWRGTMGPTYRLSEGGTLVLEGAE